MSAELFWYDGKRVLVVGGAAGMGATAAQLGAGARRRGNRPRRHVEYDCDRSLQVDLSDKRTVEDRRRTRGADAYQLHQSAPIIDTLVADARLRAGSNLGVISSLDRAGWQSNIPLLRDFPRERHVAIDGTLGRASTTAATPMSSRSGGELYVTVRALDFAKHGMRDNEVIPGGTDTPLAHKHARDRAHGPARVPRGDRTSHLTPVKKRAILSRSCAGRRRWRDAALLLVDDGSAGSTIAR